MLHSPFVRPIAIGVFLALIVVTGVGAEAQMTSTSTLTIEVTHLQSAQGAVYVGLYDNAGDFLHIEDAYATASTPAERGRVTLTLAGLPDGTYAISLFHDEDGDGALNTNLFHFPTEGVGLSNNIRPRFGPPRFRDAAFDISGDTNLTIEMRY